MNEETKQLGEAYRQWKDAEKSKNVARDKFFRAVTEELEQEIPPQVVERVEASDDEQALRIAQRRFVRHRVVDVARVSDTEYDVILEEDASLRPYSYINRDDGTVYRRIISEGTPILDDEALRDESPELWEAITEEVVERKLKPLDKLTPEETEALRPYIAMPKPQVKLGAPRKATQEELDGAEE
ncbi:MAG TPA: hypothetical protein VIJ87_01050 [Pyrinomonadaceae bacterium]